GRSATAAIAYRAGEKIYCEREGRWWWEEATQKECGLHAGNLKK
ncbi:hypothetical protein J973_4282, partial [Acinetobacter baumannii 26016_7]